MPLCDLCGKEAKLVRAEIEGTELAVCQDCAKFGKVLGEIKSEEEIREMLRGKASGTTNVVLEKKKPKPVEEEIEERIVPDFAEKIRKAREKRGLKQEEFAQLLHEKESVIQKWEGGSLTPKIKTAKKLEKILGINLVEEIEKEKVELSKVKGGEMTLGEVVKVRKRQKQAKE